MSSNQPQSTGETLQRRAPVEKSYKYYFGFGTVVPTMLYATSVRDPGGSHYRLKLYLITHGTGSPQRIFLAEICLAPGTPQVVATKPFQAAGNIDFGVIAVPGAELLLTLHADGNEPDAMRLHIEGRLFPQWTIGEGDISIIDPQLSLCT